MVRSLDSLLNGSWDCSLDFSFVDGLLDGSSDGSSDGRRCRRMVRGGYRRMERSWRNVRQAARFLCGLAAVFQGM
jgi:hypothetical protein